MRMKNILLGLLLLVMPLPAQESLPPDHWANAYVDYLKVRGVLSEVSFAQRPLQRQAVARALLRVKWSAVDNAGDRGMLRLLVREFAPELRLLGQRDRRWQELFNTAMSALGLPLQLPDRSLTLKPGTYGEVAYRNSRQNGSDTAADIHLTMLALKAQNLTLFGNLKLFSDAPPGYIGKEYRNWFGYMEQGYLRYHRPGVQVMLGRDWLQLGAGREAQLLFSANSRPFDMYHVTLGSSLLQFSFWGMQLDRQSVSENGRSYIANRFINGHRIQLNLHDRFYLGISEVALYGGENYRWDLGFVNPVSFYYLFNLNQEVGGTNANLFYQLDWDLYLRPDLNLYGEFLLDDFQVDNKEPGDLEPAELGLMLGINWTNPFRWNGGKLHLAYTQVRNRTYNVAAPPYGKFLHRNEEIGHFLGNNFWRLVCDVDYWLRPTVQLTGFVHHTQQGEGSVAGEFNQDFLNFTPEEGYSEPFPFGVVERTTETGLRWFVKPHRYAWLRGELRYVDIANADHLSGRKRSDTVVRLSLGWEWDRLWR